MSDILEKVQKSFQESTEQIAKLTSDLGAITDLEGELAQLSENLQKSASSLRQISKDHAKFISYATDLNQNLESAVDGLITVDPKKLNDGIRNLGKQASALDKELNSGISRLEEAQYKTDERLKNGLGDLNRRLTALEKQVGEIDGVTQRLLPQTKKSSAQAVNFLLLLFICQIVGFAVIAYRLY